MKLTALTAIIATALVAGAAVAQDMAPAATMQPIPNPPESAGDHHGMHHMMAKHHKMMKHHKMAKAADKAAMAPDAGAAAPK
jgi:hypothetical protein